MTEPQAKYEDGKLWRRAYGETKWLFMDRDAADRLATHFELCAENEHRMFDEERAHYRKFAADIRTAIKAYEREQES